MKTKIVAISIIMFLSAAAHLFADEPKSRRQAARALPAAEAPARINNAGLVKNAERFNNKPVLIQGEVIGDVMRRGEYFWFNIADESDIMGVRAPAVLAGVITAAGSYQSVGDTVEVKGKFIRADRKSGGEIYVDAAGIRVLKPGYRVFHVVETAKVKTTLMLAAMALCLGALRWLIKRRKKQKAMPG